MNDQPALSGPMRDPAARAIAKHDPKDEGALEQLDKSIRPRSASNILLIIIAAFFFGFLIWAYFTELDRTVRGIGRVIPSAQMQVVSNLEGGIVDAILVNVGDQVRVGDPLVRLDETASGAELGSERAQFNALLVKVARLEAEVAGRTPVWPRPTDRETAEQIEIERALHMSRMADLSSLTGAASARLLQARRAVAEAEASLAARRSARDAAQSEANLLKPLVERGIEPQLTYIQAENRAAVTASEAAASAASLSRAQAAVVEAQAALNQARQDWRARAADELAAAQGEVVARRRTLPALADRLRRTIIRAPLAGRVNRVMTATVGGSIGAGEPIAEIVPSEDSLIIEAMIRPSDIGQVYLEQPAQIGISAYDSAVYGYLDGEVITISPDTTTDERTGEAFYTVRVATTGELLDRNDRPLEIGPGMTTDVSLLGDKRSVLNYILTPITRLARTALRE